MYGLAGFGIGVFTALSSFACIAYDCEARNLSAMTFLLWLDELSSGQFRDFR